MSIILINNNNEAMSYTYDEATNTLILPNGDKEKLPEHAADQNLIVVLPKDREFDPKLDVFIQYFCSSEFNSSGYFNRDNESLERRAAYMDVSASQVMGRDNCNIRASITPLNLVDVKSDKGFAERYLRWTDANMSYILSVGSDVMNGKSRTITIPYISSIEIDNERKKFVEFRIKARFHRGPITIEWEKIAPTKEAEPALPMRLQLPYSILDLRHVSNHDEFKAAFKLWAKKNIQELRREMQYQGTSGFNLYIPVVGQNSFSDQESSYIKTILMKYDQDAKPNPVAGSANLSFYIDKGMDTADFDGDGVENRSDNCPLLKNPGQKDDDEDSIGDACDPDMDGDGIVNEEDAYPAINNSTVISEVEANVLDDTGRSDATAIIRATAIPQGDVEDIYEANFKSKNSGVTNITWVLDADADTIPDEYDPNAAVKNEDYAAIMRLIDANKNNVSGGKLALPIQVAPENAIKTWAEDYLLKRYNITATIKWLVDTDGDGVDDSVDQCSGTAKGTAVTDKGCPDTDSDGVGDNEDNCKEVANNDQADMDEDGTGDVCDDDIDGDTILNDEETQLGLNPQESDKELIDYIETNLATIKSNIRNNAYRVVQTEEPKKIKEFEILLNRRLKQDDSKALPVNVFWVDSTDIQENADTLSQQINVLLTEVNALKSKANSNEISLAELAKQLSEKQATHDSYSANAAQIKIDSNGSIDTSAHEARLAQIQTGLTELNGRVGAANKTISDIAKKVLELQGKIKTEIEVLNNPAGTTYELLSTREESIRQLGLNLSEIRTEVANLRSTYGNSIDEQLVLINGHVDKCSGSLEAAEKLFSEIKTAWDVARDLTSRANDLKLVIDGITARAARSNANEAALIEEVNTGIETGVTLAQEINIYRQTQETYSTYLGETESVNKENLSRLENLLAILSGDRAKVEALQAVAGLNRDYIAISDAVHAVSKSADGLDTAKEALDNARTALATFKGTFGSIAARHEDQAKKDFSRLRTAIASLGEKISQLTAALNEVTTLNPQIQALQNDITTLQEKPENLDAAQDLKGRYDGLKPKLEAYLNNSAYPSSYLAISLNDYKKLGMTLDKKLAKISGDDQAIKDAQKIVSQKMQDLTVLENEVARILITGENALKTNPAITAGVLASNRQTYEAWRKTLAKFDGWLGSKEGKACRTNDAKGVAGLEDKRSAIQQSVDAVKTYLDKAEAAMEAAGKLKDDIAALNKDIDALNSQVAALQNSGDKPEKEQVEPLIKKAQDLETRQHAIQSNLNNYNTVQHKDYQSYITEGNALAAFGDKINDIQTTLSDWMEYDERTTTAISDGQALISAFDSYLAGDVQALANRDVTQSADDKWIVQRRGAIADERVAFTGNLHANANRYLERTKDITSEQAIKDVRAQIDVRIKEVEAKFDLFNKALDNAQTVNKQVRELRAVDVAGLTTPDAAQAQINAVAAVEQLIVTYRANSYPENYLDTTGREIAELHKKFVAAKAGVEGEIKSETESDAKAKNYVARLEVLQQALKTIDDDLATNPARNEAEYKAVMTQVAAKQKEFDTLAAEIEVRRSKFEQYSSDTLTAIDDKLASIRGLLVSINNTNNAAARARDAAKEIAIKLSNFKSSLYSKKTGLIDRMKKDSATELLAEIPNIKGVLLKELNEKIEAYQKEFKEHEAYITAAVADRDKAAAELERLTKKLNDRAGQDGLAAGARGEAGVLQGQLKEIQARIDALKSKTSGELQAVLREVKSEESRLSEFNGTKNVRAETHRSHAEKEFADLEVTYNKAIAELQAVSAAAEAAIAINDKIKNVRSEIENLKVESDNDQEAVRVQGVYDGAVKEVEAYLVSKDNPSSYLNMDSAALKELGRQLNKKIAGIKGRSTEHAEASQIIAEKDQALSTLDSEVEDTLIGDNGLSSRSAISAQELTTLRKKELEWRKAIEIYETWKASPEGQRCTQELPQDVQSLDKKKDSVVTILTEISRLLDLADNAIKAAASIDVDTVALDKDVQALEADIAALEAKTVNPNSIVAQAKTDSVVELEKRATAIEARLNSYDNQDYTNYQSYVVNRGTLSGLATRFESARTILSKWLDYDANRDMVAARGIKLLGQLDTFNNEVHTLRERVQSDALTNTWFENQNKQLTEKKIEFAGKETIVKGYLIDAAIIAGENQDILDQNRTISERLTAINAEFGLLEGALKSAQEIYRAMKALREVNATDLKTPAAAQAQIDAVAAAKQLIASYRSNNYPEGYLDTTDKEIAELRKNFAAAKASAEGEINSDAKSDAKARDIQERLDIIRQAAEDSVAQMTSTPAISVQDLSVKRKALKGERAKLAGINGELKAVRPALTTYSQDELAIIDQTIATIDASFRKSDEIFAKTQAAISGSETIKKDVSALEARIKTLDGDSSKNGANATALLQKLDEIKQEHARIVGAIRVYSLFENFKTYLPYLAGIDARLEKANKDIEALNKKLGGMSDVSAKTSVARARAKELSDRLGGISQKIGALKSYTPDKLTAMQLEIDNIKKDLGEFEGTKQAYETAHSDYAQNDFAAVDDALVFAQKQLSDIADARGRAIEINKMTAEVVAAKVKINNSKEAEALVAKTKDIKAKLKAYVKLSYSASYLTTTQRTLDMMEQEINGMIPGLKKKEQGDQSVLETIKQRAAELDTLRGAFDNGDGQFVGTVAMRDSVISYDQVVVYRQHLDELNRRLIAVDTFIKATNRQDIAEFKTLQSAYDEAVKAKDLYEKEVKKAEDAAKEAKAINDFIDELSKKTSELVAAADSVGSKSEEISAFIKKIDNESSVLRAQIHMLLDGQGYDSTYNRYREYVDGAKRGTLASSEKTLNDLRADFVRRAGETSSYEVVVADGEALLKDIVVFGASLDSRVYVEPPISFASSAVQSWYADVETRVRNYEDDLAKNKAKVEMYKKAQADLSNDPRIKKIIEDLEIELKNIDFSLKVVRKSLVKAKLINDRLAGLVADVSALDGTASAYDELAAVGNYMTTIDTLKKAIELYSRERNAGNRTYKWAAQYIAGVDKKVAEIEPTLTERKVRLEKNIQETTALAKAQSVAIKDGVSALANDVAELMSLRQDKTALRARLKVLNAKDETNVAKNIAKYRKVIFGYKQKYSERYPDLLRLLENVEDVLKSLENDMDNKIYPSLQ